MKTEPTTHYSFYLLVCAALLFAFSREVIGNGEDQIASSVAGASTVPSSAPSESFAERIVKFTEAREWIKAIGYCREALAADPNDRDAQFWLAVSLDGYGDTDEALRLYQ